MCKLPWRYGVKFYCFDVGGQALTVPRNILHRVYQAERVFVKNYVLIPSSYLGLSC